MQCSSQVFECRTFPTVAAKSLSQKLTLLPPIPQTFSSPVSLSTETSFDLRLAYPAGDGSAAILCRMPQIAAAEHPKVRKESTN
jgi:hypothetical protein